MLLGVLLAVIVLGFPFVFLVGLVHGMHRITGVGLARGDRPAMINGPAEDSRDQVDLSSADRIQIGGSNVPRIGPFVSTCLVLVVVLLAIALALSLAEH